MVPKICIKDCNFLCVGEGKKFMIDIAKAIKNKKPLDNIKNLWIKKDYGIIRNEIRDSICNLDKLPFPDYAIETHYILDNGCLIQK